jgi:hypothetical protein
VGEGAAVLNEQQPKIVHGELYADKPVFEEWRQEGRKQERPSQRLEANEGKKSFSRLQSQNEDL